MYYHNNKHITFFENKRFDDSNLPTYEELSLIFEKYLPDDWKKYSHLTISLELWERLKEILYFPNHQELQIKDLRDFAVKNNRNLEQLMRTRKVLPLQQMQYDKEKSIIEATKYINIEGYSSLHEYLCREEHIGTCGITAVLFCGMFKEFRYYHRGYLPMLKGSKNSEYGQHAWLETRINDREYIIDTSMLLAIPIEYKEILGYYSNSEPYTREELLESNLYDDLFWYQEQELKKYSTVNKASYKQYLDYTNQLEWDKHEIEK